MFALLTALPLAAQQRGGIFYRPDPQDLKTGFEQPNLIGGDTAGSLTGAMIQTFALPDARQAMFRPFPVLVPPGSPYPNGELPPPFLEAGAGAGYVPPPSVPRSPNAWPGWFEGDVEDGFTADVAVLVQSTDQIWLSESESAVFLPLRHFERFRQVGTGARVEVRGGGQFVLVFQGGARLRCSGRTALTIAQLDDERVALRFDEIQRVNLKVGDRPVRLGFGDSGEIEALDGTVVAELVDGVVRCHNRGLQPLLFRRGDRSTLVPRAHAIRLLAAAPAATAGVSGPDLQLRGGAVSARDDRDPRVLRAQAQGELGAVLWCGSRFSLEPGSSLRIDPLAGTAFPDHRDESR